jgi:hypothetical protein
MAVQTDRLLLNNSDVTLSSLRGPEAPVRASGPNNIPAKKYFLPDSLETSSL